MDELKVALIAAKRAGKIILGYKGTNIKIKKGDMHNIVTEADLKSEQEIINTIKKYFPRHEFLAEESVNNPSKKSEYLWVIDPIDGTMNYSHDFPVFSVSIALYKKGKALVGVVYNPIREELFQAKRGAGSFLNGKKIKVSKNSLEKSLLSTGFYYGEETVKKTFRKIEYIYEHVQGIRETGSASIDLCNVACGRTDGYWEIKLGTWDHAAGSLIVEEAGGKVTDVDGKPYSLNNIGVVASNGKIHNKLLKLLNKK
ncbi:inositol monophosphatase [Candidatus Pacearchaeota archaeon]|nr:inositol monophosphatase [Candidatus Pacearchaeota archaeon]